MYKLKCYAVSIFLFCCSHQIAFAANLSQDLGTFFDGLGYQSNVSTPKAWSDQAAGFFSGGSAFIRNGVRNYQLVQLDLPSFRAGCGGIDLFLGGMSFIKGDELVRMGKQIMSNAGAYAADLFLETTVPEIKHVKDFLQEQARQANSTNINSCVISQNLVGGLWPKTNISQKLICKDIRTHGGLSADWAKARQDCEGAGFNEAMDKASKDANYKAEVVVNKNLLWSAIQKQAFLANNHELAELVMNLTGTIIFDKNGKPQTIPSRVDDRGLIKTLLTGGEANLWRCRDSGSTSKCLIVTNGKITIAKNKALISQVNRLIQETAEHVKSDDDLTIEEKNFLGMTSIPVLKFMTTLGQMKYGVNSVDLMAYSSLIAHDVLTQYLNELLQSVNITLANIDYTPELKKRLMEQINHAKRRIATLVPKLNDTLEQKLKLIQNMRFVEKQVTSSLGSQMMSPMT